MNTSSLSTTVCCFGEILWDILPDGPQPGGAPLNVAYHLTKLGMPAQLISGVGNDPDGERLVKLMKEWHLNTDLIQNNTTRKTGRVMASMNKDNEVGYDILFPVAWDYIELNSQMIEAAKTADYFVFGSLSARNTVTKNTLLSLLEENSCKVFDVNLRPPFYEKNLLNELLTKTDILKVNHHELKILTSMFSEESAQQEKEQVNNIRDTFTIKEVVVTKGAKGASYYTADKKYDIDCIPVEICDTIGSGDAFLAAFIASHYKKASPDVILMTASAMGAFVAARKGGCPPYELPEYLGFITK